MLDLAFAIEIARPVRDVYRVIGDPGNDTHWQGDVTRVQKLTPGPAGVGSRYLHTLRLLATQVSIELEITAARACEYYELRTVGGSYQFTNRVTLSSVQRATRLEAVIEGRVLGLPRVATIALSRVRRQQIQRDLCTLKRLMESGAL